MFFDWSKVQVIPPRPNIDYDIQKIINEHQEKILNIGMLWMGVYIEKQKKKERS